MGVRIPHVIDDIGLVLICDRFTKGRPLTK